jgi:ribosome-associated translation inhibitor RaiA
MKSQFLSSKMIIRTTEEFKEDIQKQINEIQKNMDKQLKKVQKQLSELKEDTYSE